MSKDYDAIVIGAGIIGCCTAFELAKKGWRTLNVDRLSAAGFGSTSNTCAIIRFHYSTPDGVAMAREGYYYWIDWPKHLGVVDENGMDWMFANCSATAQRGALDWCPKFKKATLPVFKELYKSVISGKETARVIRSCGKKNYKELLDKELSQMGNSEMWQAGKAVRSLRPKEKAKQVTRSTKGMSGRKSN